MKFSAISAVVMDMDGVLWRGDEPLPGMTEIFQWLHETGIPYALATNNSAKTPADYVAKLRRLGVNTVSETSIVTSGSATVAYMQTRYAPGTEVFPVGLQGLIEMLLAGGFDVVQDYALAKVVVAGIDFGLTYEKVKHAALAIRAGADFIGTNPDKTFPSPEGLIPGAGSVLAAIEAASDVTPVIIGKPGKPMFEAALNIVGTAPEKTLMIGDRLNTDIFGAQQVGMQTALVFTGVSTPQELESQSVWPDVAYEGLPELLKAWAGFEWYNEKTKSKRSQP